MDFAEHLKNSDVSKNRKVYYGRLLQNRLHEKGNVILVKVDEMCNILKSASQNLFVER